MNELATARVGDLDEHRKAIRVRWTVEKNDRYRHLEPLFTDLTDARLRTAITKACKATGTPHCSPLSAC